MTLLPHCVAVHLNSSLIGEAAFDGQRQGVARLRAPHSLLKEGSNIVEKTIAYTKSPPMNEALLVADSNEGFDFEAASAQLRQLISPGIRVSRSTEGALPRSGEATTDGSDSTRAKVINYVRHGSANTWNGGLLRAEEAKELTNAGRLPVFVMMTCLNGLLSRRGERSPQSTTGTSIGRGCCWVTRQ